jgi:hypothetical protein
MKRIAVFDDKDCPYKLKSIGETVFLCRATDPIMKCKSGICPFPKLPERKELIGTGCDFDSYYSGWNNCLDAITGERHD